MIYSIFILIFLANFVEAKYQCKNLEGKSVDWFVVYKLPKLSGSTNGKNFVYFDAQSTAWQSGNDINDPKIGVGATISQIYSSKKDEFHIMYSDDDPVGAPDSYRGHAKGVSLFDSTTGFWIIHSVPNFPSSKSYAYPSTAEKYGQSFFCVSIEVSHLTTLADHWRYIQATPYSTNAPDKFLTRFPTLKNVIAKQSLPRSATQFWTSKIIKTINGHTLMSYAKHRKFNGDIWNDIISRENKITLAVESWLNGNADDLHTTCTKISETHDITDMRIFGENFKSSKDHSKWAVSSSNNNPIVCFGDLNRQKSQLSRGGGALCIQQRSLWEIYHNSVVQVEPCKGSTHFSLETLLISFFVIFFI